MKLLPLLSLLVAAACCSAETFHCTKCKHEVLEGDAFCPNCGVKFDGIRREAPRQYAPPPTVSPVRESEGTQILRDYRARGYFREKGVDEKIDLPYGALRGLGTVALSPCEFLRSLVLSENVALTTYKDDPPQAIGCTLFGVPALAAVVGSIAVTGDVVIGALDMLSFGWIGNSVWDDPRKSAWVWRRNWANPIGWGVCNAIGI